MKIIRLLSLLLIVSMVFSCQKDEDKPTPNPNPDPEPEPVSTAEIGYQGGSLEYGGFSMNVPEGSFNGYFELRLLEYPANSLLGDKEASSFFAISGMPLEFMQPIEISIQSDTDTDLFAVLGQESRPISGEAEELGFRFLDVTKAADTYTFTLDITDIPDYATDDTLSIVLGLVKDYVKIETRGKFVVYAPAVYANEAMDLKQYLEDAYASFESQALNFSYSKRTKWPVEVSVRKLSSGTYGYFVPSKWGNNSGYMEFNEDYLSDENELKLTAGHEFFHLVQALYDPRYGFIKAISPSSYYWVEEASSVWAEGLFSSDPNYCSSIRNGHQMAPFRGMYTGAEENAQHHGYGMSAFIKYMTDTYGRDKLVKIFDHELSGSSNMAEGFSNALPDPMSDVYPEFLNQYIQGDIYDDFGASNLLGEITGTFSVNGANDTLKSFELEYPGLSAKVFKIDLNYAGFDDQNSMLIKSEGMKKLIYKIKGSELTYLGKYSGDYTLTGLQDIQQENALILVVMVNHYYTKTTEKLEMRINETAPLQIEGCRFILKNLPAIEHLIKPDGSTMNQDVIYDYTFDDDYYRPGTYSGGNFSASWDEVIGNWRHVGNMQLVIDEQTKRIVSGSIEAGIESTNNPTTYYDRMEITFSDVPSTSWGSVLWFGLSGDDFCNPSHVSHFDEESAQLNYWRSLVSYSCSSSTQFGIRLSVAD